MWKLTIDDNGCICYRTLDWAGVEELLFQAKRPNSGVRILSAKKVN